MYDEEYEEYEFSEEELEEIERKANGPEGYSEELQYVRRTHTDKDAAVDNGKKACAGGFSSHSFFFYELAELHERGLTVRHIPPVGGSWSSRFLFIDIDNDNGSKKRGKKDDQPDFPEPNITESELSAVLPTLGYQAWHFCQSTSRRPYRWHVLLFLDTPARTKAEYDRARVEADRKIGAAIAAIRGVRAMPALTDPHQHWQQCFYGPYQETETEIVLSDWQRTPDGMSWAKDRPHPIRKMNSPMPRYGSLDMDTYRALSEWVPLTSSGFARWLRNHGCIDSERIDEMEFDFSCSGILPYVRKGMSKHEIKIEEGERHSTISRFMLRFYAQARAYNLYMETNGLSSMKFTGEDIVSSFCGYVARSYDTAGGYAIGKNVSDLKAMIARFSGMSDREYLESVSSEASGRHRFRTRAYTTETANGIIDSFMGDDGAVHFESVEFREGYLDDMRVSMPTLKKAAASRGVRILTSRKTSGGSRGNSGRKPSVSWEELGKKGNVVDGVFYYSGKISSSERGFLHSSGIKVKKKIVGNQKG